MHKVGLASLLLLMTTTALAEERHPGVNALVGDVSWSGPLAADEAPEQARLSTHLRYVHVLISRLETRALSAPTRARRQALLARLLDYAKAGRFPQRDEDEHVGRRPRFIDPDGVHCAVGHLMAQSGAGELAKTIARTQNDAYVDEITTPGVSAWASRNGFTLRELSMIQPSYRSAPTADSTRHEIEDATDRLTLLCAKEHTPVDSFRIRVRGSSDGGVSIRFWGRDPFVRCFVEHLESSGGDAYSRQPSRYRFRMRVHIRSPESMLRQAFEGMVLDERTRCVPVAGDSPQYAALNVVVQDRRLRVRVRTYPRNVAAANCLAERIYSWLEPYAGSIVQLDAARVLPVARLVSDEWLARNVDSYGMNAAVACMDELALPDTSPIAIDVSGRRDAAAYELEVRAESPELATCIEVRLRESLRELTAREGGQDPAFFRIDADARTFRELQPPTQAERERQEAEEDRALEQYMN